MKVLIIKDFSTTQPWGRQTIDSISGQIHRVRPSAVVEVCAAIDGETVPDPSSFDLVVLTGGTFDLINNPPSPWVVQVLSLIRDISQQKCETKLLAFCWGHQATQFSMGGKLGLLDGGARIGVETISLTPEGQKFFSDESLTLHKYHRRVVTTVAEGFYALADNNEILISSANNVLSFQGHPEMTYEISQGLIDSDTGLYTNRRNVDLNIALQDIASSHDGSRVFEKMMDWGLAQDIAAKKVESQLLDPYSSKS